MDEPDLTIGTSIMVNLSAIERSNPGDPDAVIAAIDAQLAQVRRSLLQLAGVHDEGSD